jgi:hypothetical protein
MGCEPGNVELLIGSSPKKAASAPASSRFAMVSTPGFPGECLPGVVRKEPWGEMVTSVPSGTLVWVDQSKLAPDPKSHQAKKWWHVRLYVEGAAVEGWMHSNILKPPVWKEPPPSETPIDADTFE